MERIDQVLIVDNNSHRASEINKMLRDAKISDNIKVAVNGEHALLCLDHLDLCKRMRDQKIMVLLNLETPIMNGLDFLDHFLRKAYPGKENIFVAVMKDLSAPETIEKAVKKGIKEFISTPVNISELQESIKQHFGDKAEKKKVKFRKPEMVMNPNRPMPMR